MPINVILIGGQSFPHTISYVGPLALENIQSMRFDWAFLGTGGVDVDRGLTHSTMEEILIKKAAAVSAKKVVALADSTKFGYNALSKILPISSVHYVVTDQLPETLDQDLLDRAGVKLIWKLPACLF